MSSEPESTVSKDVDPSDIDSKDLAVDKEIRSQVAELEAKVETIEADDAVHERVQHLIGLIKDSLRSHTLSPKTQKELARLLSLTPNLKSQHVQQLNLLDLAVSTLLETDRNSSSTTPPDQKSQDKNLVFVQETRRQISQQSRAYPNILRSIFVTGGGTPYIRLISGLSWFFFLFVIAPLAVVGATLLTHAVVLDVADYQEAKEKAIALAQENKQLERDYQRLQNQVDDLQNQKNYLIATLEQTTRQLSEFSETVDLRVDASSAEAEGDILERFILTQSDLKSIVPDLETALNAEALNPKSTQLDTPLRRSAEISLDESLPAESPGVAGAIEQVGEVTTGTIAAAENIFTEQFSLILLAVAMGALGSTISVIVRANTFINQAQATENDLFLTGFFRPFVGMSFAIFCVALVEAGIFSGIFDINKKENSSPVYFYVAIAFVAGFSERLVRDVVIKTEDTIAGPKPRD